jgi:NADPH2:quinone reductase
MECLPDTAHAWFLDGEAEPSNLRLKPYPLPPIGEQEVMVCNKAIGLNPVDWKVLAMKQQDLPGVDAAGIVVAVGLHADPTLLGKRVAYHQSLHRAGTYSEFTVVDQRILMRVPDALSFTMAAAFPCPALTAWQALEKFPVKLGKSVLISGAGGSVGQYLVQLAALRGFNVTTLSHPRHHEKLQALGAGRCLNNTGPMDDPALMASFYAVIDTVSADSATQLACMLRANGHLVAIQDRPLQWPSAAFSECWSLHEVALGALHRHGDAADWQALTFAGEQLMTAIANNTLHTDTLITASFSQLPQQLTALKYRQFSGKLVMTL